MNLDHIDAPILHYPDFDLAGSWYKIKRDAFAAFKTHLPIARANLSSLPTIGTKSTNLFKCVHKKGIIVRAIYFAN